MGLGAGQMIPTYDEYMLLSGNAVYPLWIHRLKMVKDDKRTTAYRLLGENSYNLLLTQWGDKGYYITTLLNDGWHISRLNNSADESNDLLMTMRKGSLQIKCYFPGEVQKGDITTLRKYIATHKEDTPLYIVPEVENIEYLLDMLCREGEVKKLSAKCYQVIPAE